MRVGAAEEEGGWSSSWLCFGSIWMLNVLIVCVVGHRVLCKDVLRRRQKTASEAGAAASRRDGDDEDDFDLLVSCDKKPALLQTGADKFWRLKSLADRSVRNGNHLQAFMTYRQCLGCLDRYTFCFSFKCYLMFSSLLSRRVCCTFK